MEGWIEQRIYVVGYVTCISKGISVAAVLNTDSGDPGEERLMRGQLQ